MSQNGMDTGGKGYWLIILLLSAFIIVLGAGTVSALIPARANITEETATAEPADGIEQTAEPADGIEQTAKPAAEEAGTAETAAAETVPDTAEDVDKAAETVPDTASAVGQAAETVSDTATAVNQAVEMVSEAAAAAQDALEITERRRKRAEDWRLILVNPEHKAPADYKVKLAVVDRGYQVDERCAEELTQMLADCRKAGNDPIICSAYRERAYQEQLFRNSVWNFRNRGYSEAEAIELTSQELAVPGTSEHELGLAVDIVSRGHQILDKAQENTGTQKWLMKNSWKYGFVLRYPTDRTDVTGIIYEPWHYRYVGKEYAKEMYEKGLCLEEFLAE